jgi:fructokinase
MFQKKQYICSFGEVLWDIFPSGKLPGGAPMNLAIGVQNLGIPAVMLSRVGKDELGTALQDFLKSKNCTIDYVQVDSQRATGIVQVMTATSTGENHYEIVENSAWDYLEATPAARKIVQNAFAIAYGTLSCRNEVSKNALLNLLKNAPLKIYDVNFRQPFYNQVLVEELMQPADVVKMNDEELEIMSHWYDISSKTAREQMQHLKNKFNLDKIMVTKGANGASLLDHSGYYESQGFKVQVVDTVGSGDAFLAGFLKSFYFEHAAPQAALRFACALGAYVATHKGANPIVNQSHIYQIFKQNEE